MSESEHSSPVNFIYQIIRADQQQGKHDGRVVTRFPPEPNGYLHIGHAKSICLNFGAAATFGGLCNLRFDDTNPEKENVDFIESIRSSIRWLGFDWGEREYYASGYFEQLYDYAHELIDKGLAYVCTLSAEQAREYRGTLTSPGRNSPDRERSIEDSKDLFQRMRAGEFADGSYSLRAKIDMTSANMNMRDPVIYRIRHLHHHQTGDQWCIYPTYDFTHGLSDAIEGITHSLCSLEFEDHRPLYDWFLDNLDVPARPRQYEFARLNLNYTVMSKRKLLRLVERGDVAGWDDPRMPTLEGMRRRGYTAAAIRQFCEMIGVTRTNSVVDMAMLEHCLRDNLDKTSPRAMCVLRPLKVVLDSYPADQEETLTLPSHPKDESMGQRQITFRRELYIDRNDFAEEPPKGFKRLIPGGEVRLRGAYVIRCDEIVRDERGEIIELRCSHDPATLGNKPEGRKVKGVIHWVPVDAPTAEIRLYDRLFNLENPEAGGADYTDNLNPDSLQILQDCRLEPGVESVAPEARFQFEREGFFCADRDDHQPDSPVFNLTIGLRDTWGKG